MSDDMTIPRKMGRSWPPMPLAGYADIRDEMVAAHAYVMGGGGTVGVQERAMDAALAVVRKHIESMPAWNGSHTAPDYAPDSPWLDKDDVLDLLGGDCVCGHSSDRHDGEDGCIECRCHR